MKQEKMTVGAFEYIKLPAFGNVEYLAKIDTGAYHGAVHVDKFAVNDDDSVTVWLGNQTYKFAPEKIKKTKITSSGGHVSFRPVVQMSVVVQGVAYQTWIGLTSRQKMKFPALLGRYFLRENNFLVDVKINSGYDVDGRRSQ